MLDEWLALLDVWSVNPVIARETFEDVCQRYNEPSRYYHTLDHIRTVLKTVENLESQARDPNAVRLAAWLHDVVYDSRGSDNERRSADYAVGLCEKLFIRGSGRIESLILKTGTHDAAGDPDAQVLLDADCAVLGACGDIYRAYAENIRREYAWMAEPDYRAGRRKVLESFLARPVIYYFLTHLEGPARLNMAAEIDRLPQL